MKIAAIAAMDEGRLIGSDNAIPWRYSEDMKHFADLTTGHTVLMGRKTYESLPVKFRPLPKRLNVVVSRSALNLPSEVIEAHDLFQFLEDVKAGAKTLQGETLWVIGGANIYQQTVPFWDEAYITIVPGKHTGDAYFPTFEDNFNCVSEEKTDSGLCFLQFVKK